MEIFTELQHIIDSHKGEGQNKSFDFKTLVSCIRSSNVAEYFNFEEYDKWSRQNDNVDLEGFFFKWKDSAGNFVKAQIKIPFFIRREGIDRNFSPILKFRSRSFEGWMYYQTIPQLISSLNEIFPMLLSMSERYAQEEQEQIRVRERLQASLDNLPKIIQEYSSIDNLQYTCRRIDDHRIELSFRLPKKMRLSFRLRVEDIDNKVPVIASQILKQANEMVSQNTVRFRITGYGNDEKWKEINE